VGEDIHISCYFIGQPQPSVTWFTGEHTITPNDHYKIETVNDCTTLTIKQPDVTESADFTLVLENPAGKATHTVTLDVLGW
jgi:hypothetical protein